MILNIKFRNFRSFKDEINFSMIAESSKSKENNVITEEIGKEDNIRVLNTCAIIGANASGKSTLFRGMYDIINFISGKTSVVGNEIKAYDSFAFNMDNKNSPIEFSIDFILKNVKYIYSIEYDSKNVIKEVLEYYPKNKKQTLLQRNIPKDVELIKHIGYIGAPSKNKKVELFHNQLLLSKFGTDIPNEIISDVFLYFKNIDVINAVNTRMLSSVNDDIKRLCDKNSDFREKLNKLIKLADTGINNINVSKIDKTEFNFPNDFSDELKNNILEDNKFRLTSYHSFYQKDELLHHDEAFPFEEESHGTKTLFALGGKLLQVLEKGIPVFVDEIETSLHPFLTKMLISLFQNTNTNTNNAQLIFTSHDTNILDRNTLRKDQVWLAEKNKKGETVLFSLQDFTDVREDTPFDKWYLAGKFGALPNIKSLENFI